MTETAFTVKTDSDFYRKYFDAIQEKQLFISLAHDFFAARNLNPGRYLLTERLICSLTDEQKDWYAGQILKKEHQTGCSMFSERSAMQKAWAKDVVSHVDMEKFRFLKFWWLPFIMKGQYALWDYGGTIYGLLTSSYDDEIKLDEDMVPIKMSEYYYAVENLKEW